MVHNLFVYGDKYSDGGKCDGTVRLRLFCSRLRRWQCHISRYSRHTPDTFLPLTGPNPQSIPSPVDFISQSHSLLFPSMSILCGVTTLSPALQSPPDLPPYSFLLCSLRDLFKCQSGSADLISTPPRSKVFSVVSNCNPKSLTLAYLAL